MSNGTMKAGLILAAALRLATPLQAQTPPLFCEDRVPFEAGDDRQKLGPRVAPAPVPSIGRVDRDLLKVRVTRYAEVAARHRLCGLASYYSASLEGTLTANGERYHNRRLTAAHLTLPLGSWVEVKSRATGRTLRLRVNDRGPYVHKFMLDLSYAAAHALGVDEAEDRHVDVRIVALPGEEPLPDNTVDWASASAEESGTLLAAR
ncbi:MAG: septal ring lytic transglycosylase RlpA family protein [Acidobacteriota bacterium]